MFKKRHDKSRHEQQQRNRFLSLGHTTPTSHPVRRGTQNVPNTEPLLSLYCNSETAPFEFVTLALPSYIFIPSQIPTVTLSHVRTRDLRIYAYIRITPHTGRARAHTHLTPHWVRASGAASASCSTSTSASSSSQFCVYVVFRSVFRERSEHRASERVTGTSRTAPDSCSAAAQITPDENTYHMWVIFLFPA